jgi:DNA-binding NarL/FixJ family response regulator
MDVLLATAPGLFADLLCQWLRGLLPNARILRGSMTVATMPRRRRRLHLAVIDIDNLRMREALVAVRNIRKALPDTPLLVLGSRTGQGFIGAGANAYLPKNQDELAAIAILETVIGTRLQRPNPGGRTGELPSKRSMVTESSLGESRRMVRQPYRLTARELDVLELACFGLTNLQIAKRYKISVGVVKLHLHHAYEKLGVEGRVQAIRIASNLDAIRLLQLERVESAPALLDCLLPHMAHEQHGKGHVLFRKGEAGHAMYYVQRGRVKLPEIGVTVGEGEIFGELGIFAPTHARTSSASCEVATDLFKLTAEQTRLLCLENPQFAYYIIRLIANRLVDERTR